MLRNRLTPFRHTTPPFCSFRETCLCRTVLGKFWQDWTTPHLCAGYSDLCCFKNAKSVSGICVPEHDQFSRYFSFRTYHCSKNTYPCRTAYNFASRSMNISRLLVCLSHVTRLPMQVDFFVP